MDKQGRSDGLNSIFVKQCPTSDRRKPTIIGFTDICLLVTFTKILRLITLSNNQPKILHSNVYIKPQ